MATKKRHISSIVKDVQAGNKLTSSEKDRFVEYTKYKGGQAWSTDAGRSIGRNGRRIGSSSDKSLPKKIAKDLRTPEITKRKKKR